MQSIGIVDFRTGGSEGKWRLLAGEWADMDEALLPLELRYCPRCREVAFRKP
jgi:alpha/beta superfamily hydrolase